jgi:hypothetical protein
VVYGVTSMTSELSCAGAGAGGSSGSTLNGNDLTVWEARLNAREEDLQRREQAVVEAEGRGGVRPICLICFTGYESICISAGVVMCPLQQQMHLGLCFWDGVLASLSLLSMKITVHDVAHCS